MTSALENMASALLLLYYNATTLATSFSSYAYFCLLKEIMAPQQILEKHFTTHAKIRPEGKYLTVDALISMQ